jgi:hypothetical protein
VALRQLTPCRGDYFVEQRRQRGCGFDLQFVPQANRRTVQPRFLLLNVLWRGLEARRDRRNTLLKRQRTA